MDTQGLYTMPAKVRVIALAPESQNVLQLRSFLGQMNYYANLATIIHPINMLLHQAVKWHWNAINVPKPSMKPSKF